MMQKNKLSGEWVRKEPKHGLLSHVASNCLLPLSGLKQDHKVRFKLPERTWRGWDCWRGGLPFTTHCWKQKQVPLVLDQLFKLLSSILLGKHFSKLTPEGTHLAKVQTGRRLPTCSSPLQQTAAPCRMVCLWKEVLGPQLPRDTEHTAGQTDLLGVLLHTFIGCSPFYCLTFAKSQVQNGLAGAQACSWLSQVNIHCQKNFPWKQWSSSPPCLTSNRVSVFLATEQASRQRRCLGVSSVNTKGKQELNSTTPLWACTTGSRPLRIQPPTYLFAVRGLMDN